MEFMRLKRTGPAAWEVNIPGVGVSRSVTVKDAPANARALVSRELGVPPESVEVEIVLPVSELRGSGLTVEVVDLLAEAVDAIGRALTSETPCDNATRLGRLGWLDDGTPVIYL